SPFFFFFSSRRRHTRFSRDWSSDVCSSDLPGKADVPYKVCVVGGGLLGAVLALRLREQGRAVTLLEAAPAIGGLASPETIGGYEWGRCYHVVLHSDPRARPLIEERGRCDPRRWVTHQTGVFPHATLSSR